ncbi:hypothetical protein BU15DRAFT_81085 [Melanogaster broomeanus]|nr:hypothetical protein BU15DRAFT_81085 [Melanogaster broomeanus]
MSVRQLPESIQAYGVDIESRLFRAIPLSRRMFIYLPSTSPYMRIHQGAMDSSGQGNVPRARTGGYAQLIEIGPEWVSGPKTATHSLFIDDLLGKKGMLWRCGVYIADILKNAGFVDVKSEEVVMKLGKWAGQDGVLGRDVTMGAWRGMRDATMRAGGLGYFSTAEEFDKALDEIEEEWDSVEGSYTTLKSSMGESLEDVLLFTYASH